MAKNSRTSTLKLKLRAAQKARDMPAPMEANFHKSGRRPAQANDFSPWYAIPTADPPIRSKTNGKKTSVLIRPAIIRAVSPSQVPATATQIGHILGMFLEQQDNGAQNNHRDPSSEPHKAFFFLLPAFNFFRKRRVARNQKNDHKRQHKDDVVEKKIPEAFQVSCLVMQKPEHHQIRPARARKLAEPHQAAQKKRRRD